MMLCPARDRMGWDGMGWIMDELLQHDDNGGESCALLWSLWSYRPWQRCSVSSGLLLSRASLPRSRRSQPEGRPRKARPWLRDRGAEALFLPAATTSAR